jgi:hypothetical protein
MNDEIKEDQNKLKLKEYFLRNSNIIDKKCTLICGFNKFEDYIIFKKDENYVVENNYLDALKCYDKCLSKNFSSSILGLQMLNENLNL